MKGAPSLRIKKWNPYCFRHSAITDDSDHLPEYAVKKKARWVMASNQANRYIKKRWGDDLKDKILEHLGIKIANKQQQMVSRMCGRCNYVNKLENKYCEGKGCNYPLTQLALDEIKAAEQSKMQELINKSNLERDNTIQALRQEMRDMMELSAKQNGMISDYKGMVKEGMSRERKLTDEYHDLKGLFDKSVSMTKTAFGRIDELQSVMSGGVLIKLLIKPWSRTADIKYNILNIIYAADIKYNLTGGTRLEGEGSLGYSQVNF